MPEPVTDQETELGQEMYKELKAKGEIVQTHATSIKRACPASRARMAPTAAINRATPATTSAIQLKILFIARSP
jgi:hypothetical protein